MLVTVLDLSSPPVVFPSPGGLTGQANGVASSSMPAFLLFIAGFLLVFAVLRALTVNKG